jgi:hypothetical protein
VSLRRHWVHIIPLNCHYLCFCGTNGRWNLLEVRDLIQFTQPKGNAGRLWATLVSRTQDSSLQQELREWLMCVYSSHGHFQTQAQFTLHNRLSAAYSRGHCLFIFIYLLFYCCAACTLWDLQKFLQYVKYLIVEFTPPSFSFIPFPHSWNSFNRSYFSIYIHVYTIFAP